LPFLEHATGNLAEPLGCLGVLLHQLAEPDRRREARRPGADDCDPDLDPLVDRIGRGATASDGDQGGG